MGEGLVEDFHQPAAADRNWLAGADVLGAVAEVAVDVRIVGRKHLGIGLGLRLAQSLNVELGGLMLRLDIDAHGLEALGLADAVAHFDPQGFQLRGLRSVLRNDFYNILIQSDFQRKDSFYGHPAQIRGSRDGRPPQ